jgi:hypothetical protein
MDPLCFEQRSARRRRYAMPMLMSSLALQSFLLNLLFKARRFYPNPLAPVLVILPLKNQVLTKRPQDDAATSQNHLPIIASASQMAG